MLVYPLQLDRDGLDDLNVQVNWQRKGGTYWVRYVHVELLGFDTAGKKNMWWTLFLPVLHAWQLLKCLFKPYLKEVPLVQFYLRVEHVNKYSSSGDRNLLIHSFLYHTKC